MNRLPFILSLSKDHASRQTHFDKLIANGFIRREPTL